MPPQLHKANLKSFLPITGSNPLPPLSWSLVRPFRHYLIYIGTPPKWTPKPLPIRIQQDRGLAYIDQNRFRNPTFPLESLFRSIYAVNQAFDPKSIDLVTDRNNLRKLMFAVSNIHIENFRVEIEIVGDTMLFTRCERNASEFITEFRGFGHEFEKRFTTYPDSMSSSTGHHRVVQYTLGKLTMIVRFEVDGYIEEKTAAPKKDADIDGLASSLQSIQLTQPGTMKVIRRGQKISHDSLLELKTRAKHRPIQNSDVIYQLWFSRVPHLIVGYHMRGAFSGIPRRRASLTAMASLFESITNKRSGRPGGYSLMPGRFGRGACVRVRAG